jgi:hypothetical protein
LAPSGEIICLNLESSLTPADAELLGGKVSDVELFSFEEAA